MPAKSSPSAGVIGLGIIGSRVASLLRDAGYTVSVWSRSPKPEPHFLASPAEVVDAADIIQIFVTDGPALLEVLEACKKRLEARHIILNHATVAPEDTARAGELVQATGARFIDAPFTGSRDAAAKGELVYYICGNKDAIAAAKPLLEVTSKAIVEFPELGQATLVKIATNIITATTGQALAEALAVLDKAGVPLGLFATALEWNAIRSGFTDMKVPAMIQGDFAPRFSLKNMLKDAQIALALADKHGLELPALSAFAGSAMSGIQKGWMDDDFTSVARHYEFPEKGHTVASGTNTPPATDDNKSAPPARGLKGLFRSLTGKS